MRISTLLPLLSLAVATCAFTPPRLVEQRNTIAPLYNVIRAETNDFGLDPNTGGVGLAAESVIKVAGEVKHKPGSARSEPAGLLRYNKLQEVSESQVNSAIQSIVCTGRGKEYFSEVGETTSKEVVYAPLDAVRDALNAAGSTQDVGKLVINFLGGDDLQILQVLSAVEQLVLNLDVKTSTKVSFNSLCHTSFPVAQSSVTLVATNGQADAELSGTEQALANGEVYFQDGKYYTVSKEDINAAVA